MIDAVELSPLIQKTQLKLESLPLSEAKQAGIWRDRSRYFLNIAYPSMQAMEEVSAEEVYTPKSYPDGKDVALYIHIPFCTGQCYYCHYYKQFKKPSSQVDQYLESVQAELEMHKAHFGEIRARSVYVGGGTPSYLSPGQIDRLFTSVSQNVFVNSNAEISFEVHPESGTDDRFAVLREHRVNRINIGVESFDDQLLASENRRHSASQAQEVFERAKSAGFSNVNLDLIYGLKGQTVPVWEHTLDVVAALQPASATMYYLRLKTGTPEFQLWQKDPSTFPSDNELLIMHAMNFERMEGELGYTQSPVDWFIKDPKHFHTYQDHNWRRSDETELLGVGASAYSYVDGWQYYNVNDSGRYKEDLKNGRLPIWKGERLTGDEPMRRTIMLGIKMGIDRASFQGTYGKDVLTAFEPTWERMAALGLVEVRDSAINLTYLGKLLADEVGQQFYSAAMKQRMAGVNPHLVSTTWPQFNP